jgi:protein-disulfide isomerase
MRILTTVAMSALLAFGAPALAQAPAKPAPTQQQTQSQPRIQSVQIVDIKDLPADVRAQVDSLVSRTSEDDMKSLRTSLDASPNISSALKAKGVSSAQVIAINLDTNGVLTMFTKTAA